MLMDRQYWLIIYNPAIHIDICRQHKLISFNTHNKQAMKLFAQMKPGDVALVKHAGAHIFTDVWEVTSMMRPNPNDSQPWASKGNLMGRAFTFVADIKVLEVFHPYKILASPIKSVIGNKNFRPGIVNLDKTEFHILYRMLTGKICPY